MFFLYSINITFIFQHQLGGYKPLDLPTSTTRKHPLPDLHAPTWRKLQLPALHHPATLIYRLQPEGSSNSLPCTTLPTLFINEYILYRFVTITINMITSFTHNLNFFTLSLHHHNLFMLYFPSCCLYYIFILSSWSKSYLASLQHIQKESDHCNMSGNQYDHGWQIRPITGAKVWKSDVWCMLSDVWCSKS